MSHTSEFEGQHVVVTGGTGALGRSVVGALLTRGAQVHIPVMFPRELEGFPYVKQVHAVEGVDLRDEASCAAFFGSVEGPLYASIHLAGGFSMAPIEDTSVADYQKLVDLNLTTCFLSCREAVRCMSGEGRIVNVAAKPALVPTGGLVAYSLTKAAVAGLTLSLAEEVRERGIWVNAVVPSTMNTPANVASMPDADHGAWPTTDDVAATIAFLASPSNRSTRGALVPVYGRT
ncbi:MAG: SDR family NAD(P)-dependent oxidoreductase [Polyangiales bacterium]|nr:SDR family NAD(P)-dependent oxidoreductase [Myxococcales bacterium]MCB9660162.1 SDR family NAD(P)-dependent oxidoreductase [Sandaracinaceae bacterium]